VKCGMLFSLESGVEAHGEVCVQLQLQQMQGDGAAAVAGDVAGEVAGEVTAGGDVTGGGAAQARQARRGAQKKDDCAIM